jgi:outer membrane protein assembly factor BamA
VNQSLPAPIRSALLIIALLISTSVGSLSAYAEPPGGGPPMGAGGGHHEPKEKKDIDVPMPAPSFKPVSEWKSEYDGKIIGSIDIDGLKRIEKDAVLAKISAKVGAPLSFRNGIF